MNVVKQLANAYQIAGKLITEDKLKPKEVEKLLNALQAGIKALESKV